LETAELFAGLAGAHGVTHFEKGRKSRWCVTQKSIQREENSGKTGYKNREKSREIEGFLRLASISEFGKEIQLPAVREEKNESLKKKRKNGETCLLLVRSSLRERRGRASAVHPYPAPHGELDKVEKDRVERAAINKEVPRPTGIFGC